VVLAARGARKMNGTEEPLGDKATEKRLRSQARWIYVESAIAAVILTVLSLFFASVSPEAARSYKGLSLKQAVEFLIEHGYTLLFPWVLLEQMVCLSRLSIDAYLTEPISSYRARLGSLVLSTC
jgi:hypothetical protein